MLSIVISVYNVGPYIEDCVKSVLELTIPCEVIIVHDEQKDDSFKGDEDYLKDERITILNRVNAGLGIARNQGLEVARGEYVHFLDGDDRVFADRMEILYKSGMASGSDIICGDYDDSDNPKKCNGPQTKSLMNGPDFLFHYCDTMNTCVWRFIFKRDFLLTNELAFNRVKYFEDLEFLPRAIYKAQLVYFENIPFYYYRYTENTLSNVFNNKRTLDIYTCFMTLNDFSNSMTSNVGQVLRNNINNLVLGTIYSCGKKKGLDDEVVQKSKECMRTMKPGNVRVYLCSLANKLSWDFFLFCNDIYYSSRLFLGTIKQKINNI